MFRHKNTKISDDQNNNKATNEKEDVKDKEKDTQEKIKKVEETKGPDDNIKELLEKNLKWSQIIYEQNRRLNHKLIWAAVAGWLRLFLIVVPLVLAFFYLSPFVKQVWQSYNSLLGFTSSSVTNTQIDSLENLFKMFNLNKTQQDQIKSILK